MDIRAVLCQTELDELEYSELQLDCVVIDFCVKGFDITLVVIFLCTNQVDGLESLPEDVLVLSCDSCGNKHFTETTKKNSACRQEEYTRKLVFETQT